MARLDVTTSFYGGRGFSLYHACGSHSKVPQSPHFHDEYLISAQIKGREQCHIAGKLHEFAEGDLVLINPQQVHTGNMSGEDIEYLSLYVDREFVRRLVEGLDDAATPVPEFTAVRAAGEDELVGDMLRLFELVRQGGDRRVRQPEPRPIEPLGPTLIDGHVEPGDETLVETTLPIDEALHRIVMRTFGGYSNLHQPKLRSTNRIAHHKIARAIDYMRGLPPNATDVTLEQLAQVAELSKFHFLRQFNQVVGMTPGAYLRTLRLCHAARMLRTKEDPILDIALAVGFADHPSFSRAFARYMGMTPSDYRRIGPL